MTIPGTEMRMEAPGKPAQMSEAEWTGGLPPRGSWWSSLLRGSFWGAFLPSKYGNHVVEVRHRRPESPEMPT